MNPEYNESIAADKTSRAIQTGQVRRIAHRRRPGKSRHVPEQAHVRVHQIWMGDRADNARTASYSADDLMIVERDVGRLAKYTFDMGGTGAAGTVAARPALGRFI